MHITYANLIMLSLMYLDVRGVDINNMALQYNESLEIIGRPIPTEHNIVVKISKVNDSLLMPGFNELLFMKNIYAINISRYSID